MSKGAHPLSGSCLLCDPAGMVLAASGDGGRPPPAAMVGRLLPGLFDPSVAYTILEFLHMTSNRGSGLCADVPVRASLGGGSLGLAGMSIGGSILVACVQAGSIAEEDLESELSRGLSGSPLPGLFCSLVAERGRDRLNTENTEYNRYHALFSELTELQRLLKRQNEDLRRANALKDRLFAIISHDMREPLNVLLAGLSVLANSEGLDSTTREWVLKGMRTKTELASVFFGNLIDWAKLNMGSLRPVVGVVDLAALASDVVAATAERAASGGVALSSSIPAGLGAKADAGMAEAVLRNLVVNAVKFTSTGGSVRIEAEGPSPAEVVVSVIDTGIGMDAEELEMLFDPAADASGIGSHASKGSGIGLILCRDFLETIGGRIWAESVKGEGSSFHFSLPSI